MEGTTQCIQAPSASSQRSSAGHAHAARSPNRHTAYAASVSPVWSGGAARPSPSDARPDDGTDGTHANERGSWHSPRRSSAPPASGPTSDDPHASRGGTRNRPVRRLGRGGRRYPARTIDDRDEEAAAHAPCGAGPAAPRSLGPEARSAGHRQPLCGGIVLCRAFSLAREVTRLGFDLHHPGSDDDGVLAGSSRGGRRARPGGRHCKQRLGKGPARPPSPTTPQNAHQRRHQAPSSLHGF